MKVLEVGYERRLQEVVAALKTQMSEHAGVVAELCAKVEGQQASLVKVMEEREVAAVDSPVSTSSGVPRTRLGRAAAALMS